MSKKLKAIVSVTNDLYTTNAFIRSAHSCMKKVMMCYWLDVERKSSIDLPARDYSTKRMKLLFEKGALFYASYNIRLFLLLLFRKADVLVSNDLDTLLANYMASKFKRDCELVYDSHEYFTEVPELIHRPRIQKIWLRIEQRIFPTLTKIYTVNESIAKIYSDLYTKDIKVVRNISPLWHPEKLEDKATLGIPENTPLIILQGAGINIDRGAEEAIEAMQSVDAVLMIVGSGDVIDQLKARVKKLKLEEKGDILW